MADNETRAKRSTRRKRNIIAKSLENEIFRQRIKDSQLGYRRIRHQDIMTQGFLEGDYDVEDTDSY